MGKSKVTIKEIADMAGVSIATVSHVINRTRYVRPELVDKIEKIIVETGYQNKIADKERKLLVGRESTIVAVIPNIESTIYRDMVAYVKQLVSVQGYQFLVAITDNDLKEETQVLAGLLVNKKVAGIIHAPVSDVATNYAKLIQSGVPFVCVERNILGSGIDSVEFRDREAIFKGADYLLASGHKNVLFFRESTDSTTRDERTKGFLSALQKYNINTNDANIVDVTLENGEDDCMLVIQKALRRYRPTAVLAGGNRITLYLMKTLRDMGIDCPGEISVVGFGDESWSELTYPPLTIIRRDVKGLSTKAVGMLFEKINTGAVISHDCYADVELVVRKSTKMLDNGPFGDKAAAPDSVVLTKEEKQRLKAGSIAHACADTRKPVKQGFFGIFEVFVDTIVICTLTALVILCSEVPITYGQAAGAELTISGFTATYGNWVSLFTAVAMCCFAFSTIIGWGLYGARCIEFLFGTKVNKPFMFVYSLVAIVGATLDLGLLWSIAETFNGLMAIPNLIAVFLLSGVVVKLVREHFDPEAREEA